VFKPLTLSLAAALVVAGCASPAPVATTATPALFDFTTQVSFDARTARRVMTADTITRVTGQHVQHLEVYLAETRRDLSGLAPTNLADASVWGKATIENVTYDANTGLATGASVTFRNLKYGTAYTIVSVAVGDDPNTPALTDGTEVLNDANLYLSAAELAVPMPVGGVYQQNLDPATHDVLHGFNADGTLKTAVSTALPAQLKSLSFDGHAEGLNVTVKDGQVSHEGTAGVYSDTPGFTYAGRGADVLHPDSGYGLDGVADAYFKLVFDLAEEKTIANVRVDYYGNMSFWNSADDGGSRVAVYKNGLLLTNGLSTAGTHAAGRVRLDLALPYPNDWTPFQPGQTYYLTVRFTDGSTTAFNHTF
jgi:hypothetical protein